MVVRGDNGHCRGRVERDATRHGTWGWTWDVGGGREEGSLGRGTRDGGKGGWKLEHGRGTDGRDVKESKRDKKGRTVTVLTDIEIKN